MQFTKEELDNLRPSYLFRNVNNPDTRVPVLTAHESERFSELKQNIQENLTYEALVELCNQQRIRELGMKAYQEKEKMMEERTKGGKKSPRLMGKEPEVEGSDMVGF